MNQMIHIDHHTNNAIEKELLLLKPSKILISRDCQNPLANIREEAQVYKFQININASNKTITAFSNGRLFGPQQPKGYQRTIMVVELQ